MPNGGYPGDYKDLWQHRPNIAPINYLHPGMEYLATNYPCYPPGLPPHMYAEYIQQYQPTFLYAHDTRGVGLL